MVYPCHNCGHRRRVWWFGFFVLPYCQKCIVSIKWEEVDV